MAQLCFALAPKSAGRRACSTVMRRACRHLQHIRHRASRQAPLLTGRTMYRTPPFHLTAVPEQHPSQMTCSRPIDRGGAVMASHRACPAWAENLAIWGPPGRQATLLAIRRPVLAAGSCIGKSRPAQGPLRAWPTASNAANHGSSPMAHCDLPSVTCRHTSLGACMTSDCSCGSDMAGPSSSHGRRDWPRLSGPGPSSPLPSMVRH